MLQHMGESSVREGGERWGGYGPLVPGHPSLENSQTSKNRRNHYEHTVVPLLCGHPWGMAKVAA